MEYLGDQKAVNLTNPLVSICVPTYQHGAYISDCLTSILAQKADFDYEILIGEDDSKDDTREICKVFAENYQDRIRLFLRNEEDEIRILGRKAGRLNHLHLYRDARGKYICICDGDDYWSDSQKIQRQFDFMEKCPDCYLCITDTVIGLHPNQKPPGIPEGLRVFKKNELKKVFYMGHISSWMMRNEMHELFKNPIVKKRIPLDQVLFSFYKSLGDVAFLPIITSYYRYSPNGVYLSQRGKKNYKGLYRSSWYLFKYIHHDKILFLRAILYHSRRYVSSLLISK